MIREPKTEIGCETKFLPWSVLTGDYMETVSSVNRWSAPCTAPQIPACANKEGWCLLKFAQAIGKGGQLMALLIINLKCK